MRKPSPTFSATLRLLGQPWITALAFAIGSTFTTLVAATIEHRLLAAEDGVQPLLHNISTLADFVLLDPLLILCLGLSIQSTRALGLFVPVLRFLLFAVPAGVFSMALYFGSFSVTPGGQPDMFKDALVLEAGFKGVTGTGWVVFFWTTLVISYLYTALGVQYLYLRHVLRLTDRDISYRPMHPDNCSSLRQLASPAWFFLNGMVLLLAIFLMFYVQDALINKLQHKSLRLEGFVAYLCLAPSLFLPPVLRLHRLMMSAKAALVAKLEGRFSTFLASMEAEKPTTQSKELDEELSALVRIRNEMSKFPVWPLPVVQLVQSSVYFLGPLLGPVLKLLPETLKLFSQTPGLAA